VALDEGLLRAARAAAAQWSEAVSRAEAVKADYHRAVRHLHLSGGSMREIAEALDVSHQRVQQMVEEAGGTAGWKPRKSGVDLACSFCGVARAEVGKLVAGPGVYICDGCVELCGRVIEDAESAHGPSHLDPVPSGSAFSCSFCGRAAAEGGRLVAGPGVKICDRCVRFSAEVIATLPE
jgi:hypothetical protein